MDSAIHIKTKVLPGKKIQVFSGSLVEGQTVDVFVVSSTSSHTKRKSVLQLLETTSAPNVFSTSEEVDAYMLRERESWEH